MAEAPRTKKDFYARYIMGGFGNKPRTWADWKELAESDYNGLVTARDMKPGGPCHYRVPARDIRAAYKHWQRWKDAENHLYVPLPQQRAAFSPAAFRYNESMPDEHLVLQGNVWMGERGLRLEYSCEKNIGHRDAVNQPYLKEAEGLLTYSLLRVHLYPSSFEDLMELLDEYEGATIEFSAYSRSVGVIPHRNVIFWECRAY